jgi:hypothetical protein
MLATARAASGLDPHRLVVSWPFVWPFLCDQDKCIGSPLTLLRDGTTPSAQRIPEVIDFVNNL